VDILNFNKVKESVSDYLKVKFELFKLDMAEHLSNIMAQVIAYIIILIILTLVMLFLSIGLAQYLNEVFDSRAIGFMIVAGIYFFFLLIVFFLLRSGKLKAFFESILINTVSQETPAEDETK
jgi:hypothetical protein